MTKPKLAKFAAIAGALTLVTILAVVLLGRGPQQAPPRRDSHEDNPDARTRIEAQPGPLVGQNVRIEAYGEQLCVHVLLAPPLLDGAATAFMDSVISTCLGAGKSPKLWVHEACREQGALCCFRIQVYFFTDPEWYARAKAGSLDYCLHTRWINSPFKVCDILQSVRLPEHADMESRLKAATFSAERFTCSDAERGIFEATALPEPSRTEAYVTAVRFLNAHGWGTRWDCLLQAFPEMTRVRFDIPVETGSRLIGEVSREAIRRIWETGRRYSERYGAYQNQRSDLDMARAEGKVTDREVRELTKPIETAKRRFVLDLWEQVKPQLTSWEWR